MTWEVVYLEEFLAWYSQLTAAQQDAVLARIHMLQDEGPALGRPTVDTIRNSRHSNMKELRTSSGGNLRVLFAFDPKRRAILLIGGDKSNRWAEWYNAAIPLADDLFDRHLREVEGEGAEK